MNNFSILEFRKNSHFQRISIITEGSIFALLQLSLWFFHSKLNSKHFFFNFQIFQCSCSCSSCRLSAWTRRRQRSWTVRRRTLSQDTHFQKTLVRPLQAIRKGVFHLFIHFLVFLLFIHFFVAQKCRFLWSFRSFNCFLFSCAFYCISRKFEWLEVENLRKEKKKKFFY